MDDVEQPRLPELGALDDGLWFIAHAALALAEQEGMGVEGRQDLARQMGQSARLPVDHPHHLRTRHLHSKLPKTLAPDEHTGLATGVYPTDVNAWLEAIDAPYRWEPKRWVHQQLEAKQALAAKLRRKPKPPPPETRLKSTMTTSAALNLIAKRQRGDEAVAAELARGGTPADLANRLQSALDELQQAKQAAQQFKEQHAGDFAAIQRLQDQIEALPQAERRRVLDAAGLRHISAAPRPLEPHRFTGSSMPAARTPPVRQAAVETARVADGVLILPAGTKHVQFGDLADLVAFAIWPDDDLRSAAASDGLKKELGRAVDDGVLAVLYPLTFGPHEFPIGAALRRGLVTVEALGAWLWATRKLKLAIDGTTLQAETADTTEGGGTAGQLEAPADRRARRLRRFEELGGAMRAAGTGWQCSGKRGALAALVREEAAAGRPMKDKSDVRSDLIGAMGDQRGS